jgi:hypothetical protein
MYCLFVNDGISHSFQCLAMKANMSWFCTLIIPRSSRSHAEAAEQEEDVDGSVRNASKKPVPAPVVKADAPEAGTNAGEPDRSDSDESDDSI